MLPLRCPSWWNSVPCRRPRSCTMRSPSQLQHHPALPFDQRHAPGVVRLFAVHWHKGGHGEPPLVRPLPALDQRPDGIELLLEAHVLVPARAPGPVGIGPRVGRPGRADGHDPADAHLPHALHVRVPGRRRVHPHDAVAAAQQRQPGRNPEHQTFQRRQPRLRAPARGRRGGCVDGAARPHPRPALAPAQRLHQPVPGVAVAIDQPGHDHVPPGVDHFRGRLRDFARRPDCHDGSAGHRNGPVRNDPPRPVHRDHGSARDQQVHASTHGTRTR